MTDLESKITSLETALADLVTFVRKQSEELGKVPFKATPVCPVCSSTVVARYKTDGRITCNRGHVYWP